jgi:hypothetical protein
MKKLTVFCVLCFAFISNLNPINAEFNDNEKLDYIIQEIELINQEYKTDFSILTEEEFYTSVYKELYDENYQIYISSILKQDVEVIKKELIGSVEMTENEVVDVKIEHLAKSSLGSKTITFYNGNNKMSLKYKYSGRSFDTSYKPIASITKTNSKNFFEMSSYSGSFKNSNKTYSVVAKGRVITITGIVSGKSYTVNFNL